jgi:hypothetical protein
LSILITIIEEEIMRKKYVLISLLVRVLLVGFSPLAMASESNINPGGPFITPEQNVSTESILTYEEIEAMLFQLEKISKGRMTLETVGYTTLGLPLYAAVIGNGETRMWIQGRIHGGERFGAEASLSILSSLLNSNKEILDEITFMIIPCYNPDGSNIGWRGNANRVDLNRNWWRTDGNDYSEPESQAFYWAWADFKPHYAIDLHHQGTYFVEDEVGEDTNEMTTFSIGIPVWPEFLEPWIWDSSRQMAVVGYDAVKDLGFCNPTRYPLINIHTAVVSSMMLGNPGPDGYDAEWETAAMFFENRSVGQKSRGHLIRQNIAAVTAIIDAIAYGELDVVDPDRWEEIPDRGRSIRRSDKWPDEWAE